MSTNDTKHRNSYIEYTKFPYLTEKRLIDFLGKVLYPNQELITQCSEFGGRLDAFIYSKAKGRQFAVEFDGYQHYTCTSQCLKDIDRYHKLQDEGISLIRIPYWVQLTMPSAKYFFKGKIDFKKVDLEYKHHYPHGFISEEKSCVLPADFCSIGFKRFKAELLTFNSSVINHVVHNLRVRSRWDPTAAYSLIMLNPIKDELECVMMGYKSDIFDPSKMWPNI